MGEATSWTDHVLNGESWRRFGFMLLFAPLLGCVGFMIAFVALFQFFSVLASGENNAQLRSLGRDLSRFAVAIMDYLTYNTDRKPFPFAASPSPDVHGTPETPTAADREAGTTSPREPARPARRAAAPPRKTTPRKAGVRRRGAAGRKRGPRKPAPATEEPPEKGDEGDRPE